MAWEAAQQQNATLMQMNAQALGAGSGPCKLYVGNLHPNISVRPLALLEHLPGMVDRMHASQLRLFKAEGTVAAAEAQ